jgi:uncharacterized radical SAM superfamily Fe-S cluster-containing enzyme
MKSKGIIVIFVILLVAAGVSCVAFYSYVFARNVEGEVVDVQRVTQPTAIINTSENSAMPAAQLYSFAVAIKDKSGEIVTASTEDRQWAVVQKGQCAKATFFPYPPWKLDKAGTYFGARLLHLRECTK